jgi:hypothetical protein
MIRKIKKHFKPTSNLPKVKKKKGFLAKIEDKSSK